MKHPLALLMSLLLPVLHGVAQTPGNVAQPQEGRVVAVKTNLVHDFAVVPQFGFAPGINLQLEYLPLKGHYTGSVGFTFTQHSREQEFKFFQIRDLQLELRRYFKGNAAYKGPYLGAYAEGVMYGIGFDKTRGWVGEGTGGGLSAGWVWALDKKGHLKLEVSLSLGVLYSRYDPFVYGNPITETDDGLYYYDYMGKAQDFQRRNHQFFWFGPTNAGIQISYALFGRKKRP